MDLVQHFGMGKRPHKYKFSIVEGFSCCRSLSIALLSLGLNAISLDKRYHESLDFVADDGFMIFLCSCRCLAPG
eukprot:5794622-Pyramimonas_sp.AAC.1